MAHIAAIAVAWTDIERALVGLVSGSLGAAHFQSEHVIGMSGNWIARTAMQQAETIRTRIKLVDATVAPLLKETTLHERWVKIRTELPKRSRERNEIIHAEWTYAAELPGEVVRLRPNHQERWGLDDFSEILKAFQQLERSISTLLHDIGAMKARGELSNPMN